MNKRLFFTALVALAVLASACAQTTASPTSTSTPPAALTATTAPPPAPASATPRVPPPTGTPAAPQTLAVMTHDSFAASEDIIKAFEQANNAKVTFPKSGDAGAALNKAILSKDAPLADVFYGVDNTFLSRALEAGIFDPYASPALEQVPAAFQLDPSHAALPVD